ncbi:MAG TPA: DUF2939 domain-containing protein [Gemmatimonadales bacterium]|nr:DUF2939 domain-containing protein [Gemmatimonadales bacterium]
MSRRRYFWLSLLVLGITCTWYWQSPRRAWDRFNRALITGQEGELQAVIDFPILRDNLRADLKAALQARGGRSGGLAAEVSGALLDRMVGAALTPGSLALTISAFGMREARAEEGPGLIHAARVRYRYRSPSRVDVEVRPEDGEATAGGIFTFERSGISWKLTRIWSERLTAPGDS